MLNFLKAVVELVDLRHNQLVFRSNRSYGDGKRLDVKLSLPPGNGRVTTLPVQILSSRPLAGGSRLYSARVLADLGETRATGTDLRAAPRYPVNVRARSRRLPGFHGLTVNMSRTGLQLEVEGPMEPGEVIDLRIELERPELPDPACEARVVWCRPERDAYRLGLEFLPESEPVRQQLALAAEVLGRRDQGGMGQLLQDAVRTPAPPGRRQALNIPLQAVIWSLSWGLAGSRLQLTLRAPDDSLHAIEFPFCQSVRQHTTALAPTTRTLRSARQSGKLRQYTFLDSGGQPILELISAPCCLPVSQAESRL